MIAPALKGSGARRAAIAGALTLLSVYALLRSAGHTTNGFISYYAASKALLSGRFGSWVYDDRQFASYVAQVIPTRVYEIFVPNPPMMALLAVPVALLNPGAARAGWLALSIAAFGVAMLALVRESERAARPLPPWFIAALMLTPSVVANLHNGQGYLFVFAALAAAVVAVAGGRQNASGVFLGLALALKSAGASLFVLLAARGKYRTAAVACLVVVSAALVVAPLSDRAIWTVYPRATMRFVERPATSALAYQTTEGLFRRVCSADPAFNPSPALQCDGVARIVPSLLIALALAATALASAVADGAAWLAAAIALSVIEAPIAADPHFSALGVAAALLWMSPRGPRSPWVWAALAVLAYVPLAWLTRFSSGWSVLAAYPRLYAAWGTWGLAAAAMRRDRERAA